ncbi:MAG: protoheme IX farnesyltransferase [Omnitrophica WOR_2 bacterium RIFCSPHIGHO2_01_FULL_48_9]|nr:MAG: protoheme IX farnesyltransferase [Omnitrophica WOR_2 bacterium RIFCSPHIGHO2_02_FULL_48_11]OGX34181.1 MAG: protoheme IX farnesyltransferase [Omnitrophica WOR_2 bacterium RIFCSPHIGHO2_01_FULL_48_9]
MFKKSPMIAAYIDLTKPRILTLVLVTTTLGFFLGGRGIHSFIELFFLLLGVALVCAGSAVLNHYLERDIDAKMLRTRNRPLPMGVIQPADALIFGIVLILAGVFTLWWKTNLLTAFLSLLSAFLYVLVYTPMKRISWLNTSIGAIPGALPPLGGWAAATGDLSLGGWVLFAILFLWQHPHFYAIAWMFKEDYQRGGFKMLPVVQPDGRGTFLQIIVFSVFLIPVSVMPTLLGMSGKLYFSGALLMGIFMLALGGILALTKSHGDARKLLKATVLYLPALLFLIILDVKF